ncbi:MAG: hypothetical protein Q8P64_10520, partial [Deltaproteobacteria bacterium]|nr:hypothetical protein [Deltaproteobacteria bacterium]
EILRLSNGVNKGGRRFMKDTLRERYGPHPKKKEKKRIQTKESSFLKRSYNWLKWRSDKIGGMIIYHPCLEH